MEFKSLLVSTLLIGLFIVALLSFGINLANNNDADNILLDDPALNATFSEMEDELKAAETSSDSQKDSFFIDVPIIGEASVIFTSITGFVRVFFNMGIGIIKAVFLLIQTTLRIPPIVTGVFTSIFIIVTLFLIWKVIRVGT